MNNPAKLGKSTKQHGDVKSAKPKKKGRSRTGKTVAKPELK